MLKYLPVQFARKNIFSMLHAFLAFWMLHANKIKNHDEIIPSIFNIFLSLSSSWTSQSKTKYLYSKFLVKIESGNIAN